MNKPFLINRSNVYGIGLPIFHTVSHCIQTGFRISPLDVECPKTKLSATLDCIIISGETSNYFCFFPSH